MSAPALTYSITGTKLSGADGFDKITVKFSSDKPYQAFECRATKAGESFGRGGGTLLASFSQTPANTERTFEIYDDLLVRGDGSYRIGLYAQGEDGSWNDNQAFVTGNGQRLVTVDGQEFFCMR